LAYDAGTYKTVGTSFEFMGLVDGTPPSTKSALMDSIMHFFGIPKSVSVEEKRIFDAVFVDINPNPFISRATIKYIIPETQRVTLGIYDITGRMVKKLVDKEVKQGSYTLDFENNEMSTGIYFIRLCVGNYVATEKLILVK